MNSVVLFSHQLLWFALLVASLGLIQWVWKRPTAAILSDEHMSRHETLTPPVVVQNRLIINVHKVHPSSMSNSH